MSKYDDQGLPPELRSIAERMREERPELSPLELDRVKLRAMARAGRSAMGKGLFMRSKIVTMMLVLGLIVSGGAAGVIAGGSSNSNNQSAAQSQYKPGKGCGDKNHVHEREGECKKPPK